MNNYDSNPAVLYDRSAKPFADLSETFGGNKNMLPTIIAITAIVALIVVWGISVQRRLIRLDENIASAMNQIGVQISSRFDALTALLALTNGYAEREIEALLKTIKAKRKLITAKSTPNDVLSQEKLITESLDRLAEVAKRHPELKANPSYIKMLDAVEAFSNMVRTSCLIYNESVSNLNREIRMFPNSAIAGPLGLKPREYF